MRRLLLLVGLVPLLAGCFYLPLLGGSSSSGGGSLSSTTSTVYCIDGDNGREICRDEAGHPVPSPDEGIDAMASVRAAVPAIEAWNADHGTYAGMTVRQLRAKYDSGITDVKIVRATKTAYCVESTVGGATYSYRGPQGPLAAHAC